MTRLTGSGHTSGLTEQEPVLRLLRDLIHERMGIFVDDDKLESIREKIEPLARTLGCQSYLDYFYILKYEEAGPREWRRVMDAFSVQETYFWREQDQIGALVEHIVPAWFRASQAPLRIWSAACASGEEPYSLAIALVDGGWGDHPIEIIASDASEAALAKARQGVYRERSFRALPGHLRAKYFEPHPEGTMLRADLRSRVTFHWANLLDLSDFAPAREVEVIFCRNVFIYFSRAAITRVVASFAERTPIGGHLFVGAAESLLNLTTAFTLGEIDGAFVYRRQRES